MLRNKKKEAEKVASAPFPASDSSTGYLQLVQQEAVARIAGLIRGNWALSSFVSPPPFLKIVVYVLHTNMQEGSAQTHPIHGISRARQPPQTLACGQVPQILTCFSRSLIFCRNSDPNQTRKKLSCLASPNGMGKTAAG